jgi:hypothetical protein
MLGLLVELRRQRGLLKRGERPLARGHCGDRVGVSRRLEVVTRLDRGQPFLVPDEVRLGLLELGVRDPAPSALVFEFLVKLLGALDHLAVLVAAFGLKLVDQPRFLLPIR